MTPQDKKEEIIEKFKEKYPINYGNPYPHFIDGTPVATHIVQFIERSLSEYGRSVEEETVRKIKELVDTTTFTQDVITVNRLDSWAREKGIIINET